MEDFKRKIDQEKTKTLVLLSIAISNARDPMTWATKIHHISEG